MQNLGIVFVYVEPHAGAAKTPATRIRPNRTLASQSLPCPAAGRRDRQAGRRRLASVVIRESGDLDGIVGMIRPGRLHVVSTPNIHIGLAGVLGKFRELGLKCLVVKRFISRGWLIGGHKTLVRSTCAKTYCRYYGVRRSGDSLWSGPLVIKACHLLSCTASWDRSLCAAGTLRCNVRSPRAQVSSTVPTSALKRAI